MQVRWLAWVVFLGVIDSLSAGWSPVKIEGRDYVSLASVAEFYGMAAPRAGGQHGGKTVYLAEGGGRSIRAKNDSRETMLNGVRQWMAFPLRERGGAPYVSRVDLSKVFEPAFRPNKAPDLPRVRTVVLDPGHGGHDKGARSKLGYEKNFALDLTGRVRKRLGAAGLKVVQTRLGDSFVPLESRPAMANKYKDSIFVSLHFNSAAWKPSAKGIEIYALSARGMPPTGQSKLLGRDLGAEDGHAMEPASTVLANAIFPAMLAGTRLYDRGIKRARFSVLRHADVPAVLIEGGFLTNPSEAALIASPAWRDQLADGIARGILAYAALAESGTIPRGVREYGGRETTEFVPLD